MSACGEQEVGLRARFAGADGFIGKPIDFNRIVDLAQSAGSSIAQRERALGTMAQELQSDLRTARAG